MNLENKKRIVAAALAGAGVVAPTASFAQNVTGGRFDSTAPVVAIEDIRTFLKADELATAEKGAAFRTESEACYMQPGAAQAVAPVSTADTKKGNKYAGIKTLEGFAEPAQKIENMPEKTQAERLAKLKEEEELQEAMREVVTKMTVGQRPATTFIPVMPVPGGKRGNAMAEATNRQMQAATNPAIASCLSGVEAKFEDKSTPMQITYQDSLFETAGKMLGSGAKDTSRVVHVTLSSGDRFNVVSKNGPYSSRIQPLESAMKVAANTRNVAPDYENTGQAAGTKGEKSRAQLFLEAMERAANAAKAK